MNKTEKEIVFDYIFSGMLLLNGVINENHMFKRLFIIASALMFFCGCFNIIKRKR